VHLEHESEVGDGNEQADRDARDEEQTAQCRHQRLRTRRRLARTGRPFRRWAFTGTENVTSTGENTDLTERRARPPFSRTSFANFVAEVWELK